MKNLQLIIAEQGGSPRSFGLGAADLFIGRGQKCAIRLNHPGLEERHARIRFTAKGHVIEDLRSRAGVRINGTASQSHLLQAGDTIQLGACTIQVQAAGEGGGAAPPIQPKDSRAGDLDPGDPMSLLGDDEGFESRLMGGGDGFDTSRARNEGPASGVLTDDRPRKSRSSSRSSSPPPAPVVGNRLSDLMQDIPADENLPVDRGESQGGGFMKAGMMGDVMIGDSDSQIMIPVDRIQAGNESGETPSYGGSYGGGPYGGQEGGAGGYANFGFDNFGGQDAGGRGGGLSPIILDAAGGGGRNTWPGVGPDPAGFPAAAAAAAPTPPPRVLVECVKELTVDARDLNVGGLDQVKRWVRSRQKGLEASQSKDLRRPRGLLLLGLPGSGRRQMTRAIAHLFRLPLKRIDLHQLVLADPAVWTPSLEKSLETLDRSMPQVVQIDDLDLVVERADQFGEATAETLRRTIDRLIWWLENRTSPHFVVITGIQIDKLPPNILRLRRAVDEVFFIDLPSPRERQQVLEIILKKRLPGAASLDMRQLVAASEGLTSGELARSIEAAMYDALAENREVGTSDIVRTMRDSPPVSRRMTDAMNLLRQQAPRYAVLASVPEARAVARMHPVPPPSVAGKPGA